VLALDQSHSLSRIPPHQNLGFMKKLNCESNVKITDYDNTHSQAFYDCTINAHIADICEMFFSYLPEKATLLDAGCGVGRDIKNFLSKGHAVSAFEASQKMVELACREIGGEVMHATFQELNFRACLMVCGRKPLCSTFLMRSHEKFMKIHRALNQWDLLCILHVWRQPHRNT
jgi:hypothetical protein